MSRPPTVDEVVARRRADRAERLRRAREYVEGIDAGLRVVAACVIGSVARGDWTDTSDVDVLVIAERLPERATERLEVIGAPAPGGIQAWAWTPAEWGQRRGRDDPAAVEAAEHGVWLIGSPTELDESSGAASR